MTADFLKFVEIIKEGARKGEIRTADGKTLELSMVDLGLQYAIGEAMENEGANEFSLDELVILTKKYCGEDIFDCDEKAVVCFMPKGGDNGKAEKHS